MADSSPVSGAELRFRDAKSCQEWLASLPLTNAKLCQQAISGQLAALARSPVAVAERLRIMESLRDAVADIQAGASKRFVGKSIPLEGIDQEAWSGSVALWQALAAGYQSCVEAFVGGQADLAAHGPLACQRALRYNGLAMFDHLLAYRSVAPGLWQQMNKLYALAESKGFANDKVSDPVDRQEPNTTCAATYLHTVLAHLANPNSMAQKQMQAVDRWLEKWESKAALAPRPFPAGQIPAVAVDLASPSGAALAREMTPQPSVRFINIEPIAVTLTQTAALLKQGTPAAELGLGQDTPQPEKLIAQLHIQWCSAGTGRAEQRFASSIKAMITTSVNAIHFQLTGKPFRQPDAGPTAEESRDMEALGRVTEQTEQAMISQRSAALETWEIINQSPSGLLGANRPPDAVTPIRHGQLVGMRTADNKMRLCVVQRLLVEDNGALLAGVRLLPGAPLPAAARVPDTGVASANKFERALLLPAIAEKQVPQSLILPAGWYHPERQLDLHLDESKLVRLQALIDRGSNFERV